MLAAHLLLGVASVSACGFVAPAFAASAMPGNARASAFGGGWDCVWGYYRVAEHCEAVKAPVDGFVDSSGRGWDCNRGFAKSEQHCVKIKLPANAHLADSWLDRDWRCNRGYRRVGES